MGVLDVTRRTTAAAPAASKGTDYRDSAPPCSARVVPPAVFCVDSIGAE
ncbi:MAG TPA: hypothetical protein VE690_10465 [Rhodopila sp.]|nr:hypothetical protein [Rhodopila sp.]